jgi:hypothetical protein
MHGLRDRAVAQFRIGQLHTLIFRFVSSRPAPKLRVPVL